MVHKLGTQPHSVELSEVELRPNLLTCLENLVKIPPLYSSKSMQCLSTYMFLLAQFCTSVNRFMMILTVREKDLKMGENEELILTLPC